MTYQYCEAYRGWHIWFEPNAGYLIGTSATPVDDLEGYYGTREEARKDIDWHASRPAENVPDDTPCLNAPWWAHP